MGAIAGAELEAKRADARPMLVRRAAVLGAGTMGSRISGMLANAGIPVLLLDMAPKEPSAPLGAWTWRGRSHLPAENCG